MPRRVKIFFDGGCRPNPGDIEIAVVAAGNVTIRKLGHGTSADAEWLALIYALKIAIASEVPNFRLVGDSADIVAKANGDVKPGDADRRHLQAFHALVATEPPPRVGYIKHTQNLAGIALAKLHR